jgi:hypothetical protein
LAFVRDANIRGAFFYCDLQVLVGEVLNLHLATAHDVTGLPVNCEASVVRVEKSALNDLTGIAVEFHRFEVEEPASVSDHALSDWSAERFERVFARRLELETCAFRIQGAA